MTTPDRRPVAMLAHSYYEEDPRVAREAEALVESGRDVEVFALRRPGTPATERLAGVQVHRINIQRHQGAGVATYLAEYLAFLGAAGLRLARAHRHRRYGLVQVHTLPDFLVFAALPLRLVGVPVLLDLHEAMPEFFRVRFPRAANPVVRRLLAIQERVSIGLATAAITVNDALGARLVALGVPASKVGVVTNSPALRRFDPAAHPARPFAADGVVRLVYAGALSPTYELDVVLQAVALIASGRPELPLVLELYGRDFGEVPLTDAAASLGVADRVRFHGRIPLDAVPAALAAADIGLAPTRQNQFTDYSLSTKVFEYAAMGKPVVASRLPLVGLTFPPETIVTYTAGDPDDLAAAILRLVDDPADREARVERTAPVVAGLGWERESERYVALVERLIGDALSSEPPPRRTTTQVRGARSEPPDQEEA